MHVNNPCFVQLVADRRVVTLLPIIQAHVQPGTVIHSDCWAAYNNVASLPNIASHGTVNHSIEFVNSVTGVHTQNIESYWNRIKIKLKRMRGVTEQQLPLYLDEFMWRERLSTPQSKQAAFTQVMADIATQYQSKPKSSIRPSINHDCIIHSINSSLFSSIQEHQYHITFPCFHIQKHHFSYYPSFGSVYPFCFLQPVFPTKGRSKVI